MTGKTPGSPDDGEVRAVHILVLEDEEAHAELIRRGFGKAAEPARLTIAKTIREARDFLRSGSPDLIIADWLLPDGKGIDILPRVEGVVTVPFVVMTSHGDEKLAVEIMKSGAMDYIVKSESTFRDLPAIARRVLREWANIRERKNAEDALRKSEEKFRAIFSTSPYGIALGDDTGRILACNPALEHMLGYQKDDLILKHFSEFTYPEDTRAEELLIRDVIAGKTDHYEIEKRYIRKDGSLIWVRLNGSLLDKKLLPAFGLAMVEDITGHKQAEETLRRSEAKYRTLHESIRDALATIDMAGRILDFNPAFLDMLGYSADELIRLTYNDLTPEKWHASEARILEEQILPRGYSDVYEKEYRKKDGTVFPVELRTFLLRDADGRPEGMWAIVRDITDRKRMERQLIAEKDRVKNLIDIAGVIILALDTVGRVTLINKRGCGILGLTPEEVVGKSWVDTFLPSRVREEMEAAFRELRSGTLQAAGQYENPVLTSSGEERIISWNNTVIRDGTGAVTGTLSSGEDITERRKAETALRENEARLSKAMDLARLAAWEFDLASGLFTFDDRFYDLLGTTAAREGGYLMPAEVYTGTFVYPDDIPMVIEEIRKLNAATDPRYTGKQEHRIIRRDGELRYIIAEYTGVFDQAGNHIKNRGVIQDITERVMSDRALALANQKLQLMNIVAWHDIYNKITGLRGYVELSREFVRDPEGEVFIRKEEEVLRAIHNHIENTKEYQELGRQPPRWLNLAETIHAARTTGWEDRVRLDVDTCGIELFADPVIGKAFAHLIMNGVGSAKGILHARFSCTESPAGLTILYEDDTEGIPGDQKESIFIRDVGKSSGFSLYFVHDCLELSGMSIRETGVYGKGARFEIIVPKGMYHFTGAGKRTG